MVIFRFLGQLVWDKDGISNVRRVRFLCLFRHAACLWAATSRTQDFYIMAQEIFAELCEESALGCDLLTGSFHSHDTLVNVRLVESERRLWIRGPLTS